MPERPDRRRLLTRGAWAFAVILGAFAFAAKPASAGHFSFARKDYLLESDLGGLDSVAVGDLDGVNGPDIVVLSYTAGGTPAR